MRKTENEMVTRLVNNIQNAPAGEGKTKSNDSIMRDPANDYRWGWRYHQTFIVCQSGDARDAQQVTITTGGWNTTTTRSRINAYLAHARIDARLFTRKGTLFISLPDETDRPWDGSPLNLADKTTWPAPAYQAEYTDTYGGEANYCWVHRLDIYFAKSLRHALNIARKHWGVVGSRVTHESGEFIRADQGNTCIMVTPNY